MDANHNATPVGIDNLSVYLPKLYLPIATLADARDIAYAKLNKGLGLEQMAVPDYGEDAATMMANAVRDLIEKSNLRPQDIGRIYLGTESALDGAKPTATYALDMLQGYFEPQYGKDCFLHCDVVDLTFACIGAVDALQNTLDWVRANPNRIGIVVAADNAKYELGSTGEYTQGAGAVAVLIKADPQLLALDAEWGVSTRAVYDFYKPLRKISKGNLISEALHLAQRNHVDVDALVHSLANSGIEENGVLDSNDVELFLHKDTPIFDGPYSNDCYQERIREALGNYARKNDNFRGATAWQRLVFHLPYAFQARRMFGEIFWQEHAEQLTQELGGVPQRDTFDTEEDFQQALREYWRMVTKTAAYSQFVEKAIQPGEWASSRTGNLYTGSIFLSLASTLEKALQDDSLATGDTLGFFAYGSGSKSKVFAGTLQNGWKQIATSLELQQQLERRTAIDYSTYEALHRGKQKKQVDKYPDAFYMSAFDDMGVRTYSIPQMAAV